ncbi:MAG: Bax protein [Motiliproteus sp.]|jgi:Bax protein
MPPTDRTACMLMAGLLLSLSGCQQDSAEDSSAARSISPVEQAPSLEPPKTGPALEAFAEIDNVKTKKTAFFNYLQPQIERENEHTGRLKAHIALLQVRLKEQGQLPSADAGWLNRVSKLYRIDAQAPAKQIELLNAKLGRIPASLVKAQAANESAWGTSRFARKANNLFGQWCFSPGCGITPLQRSPMDTHEVQAFPSVAAGLRSYFVNLNGNRSYAGLRQIRRCLQAHQQPFTGRALAAGLENYSARAGHYVEELQAMIRINNLEDWNADWWGDTDPDHPCYSLVQIQTDIPDPVKVNDQTETETETVQNDQTMIDAGTEAAAAIPTTSPGDAETETEVR